jgi:hypothetical protein
MRPVFAFPYFESEYKFYSPGVLPLDANRGALASYN